MLPDLQARAASLRREDVSLIVYQAEEEWRSKVPALLRLPCTQIDKPCVVPELQDPGP
jgi:hypothetical protein